MKKFATIFFALVLSSVVVLAQGGSLRGAPEERTFVGKIGDSQCGLKHPMGMGSDKECTLKCVQGGGKFILADLKEKIVYQLDDQKAPAQFAGQMVKIIGTLDSKTKTIKVKSIEPMDEKKDKRKPYRDRL